MKANYIHKDSTTLLQDELVKNELNQIELQYNALKQQKFNELLKENQELNKKYVNAVSDYETTMVEKEQLKYLIDTILALPFFENECPLNIGFENNSKEEKAQNIFYKDDYCENNCNDNYKDCWLRYFKRLQELGEGCDK